MTAAFSLLLMVLATLGGGAAALRGIGVLSRFSQTERVAISLVIGLGVIGWGMFFLALMGTLDALALVGFLIALTPGLYFLRPEPSVEPIFPPLDIWGKVLLAGLAVVILYDVLEGLSPPGDADTLAYHFAIPKSFLGAGQLFPIYRAVEGTIPLLQQMTYTMALGIGGEVTLTLWTMFSGWFAPVMIFVIARRYISLNYSLATALLFMTTPAVIYGAGSGQIEVRNAMFVLVAALAVSEALKTGLLRYALLAGIAAGFFVASKYTGLIFAFSCGLLLMPQKKWFSQGLVFSAALLIVGGQWYGWNWHITGDPVYPMLYGIIDYPATTPWNDNIQQVYKYIHTEKIIPQNLIWFLLYPFAVTLFADLGIESLRAGLGPLILLMLPLVLFGIWSARHQLYRHPLAVFGAMCLISYGLWFFLGPSQRVRHLLPIYPLLLLCVMVAGIRALHSFRNLIRPAHAIIFCVLLIQLAGASLFSLKYAQYIFSDETRDSFLKRNVYGYEVAKTVNGMLTRKDRVLVLNRQLVYFFDIPVLYSNPANQAVVETHRRVNEPEILSRQLQQANITHMLLPFDLGKASPGEGFMGSVKKLERAGCIKIIRQFSSDTWSSRTLPGLQRSRAEYALVGLNPGICS